MLRDYKLVDLRRSKLKKGTDRKKGIYKFEPNGKVYVSWKDPATRPPDYIKWNRNAPYDISRWEIKWGYSFVTIEDPYWPEGLKPNEEGNYVYQTDMVLVKCPLENYVNKRKKEIEKSEMASGAKRREFQELARKSGGALGEALEQRIFGSLP